MAQFHRYLSSASLFQPSRNYGDRCKSFITNIKRRGATFPAHVAKTCTVVPSRWLPSTNFPLTRSTNMLANNIIFYQGLVPPLTIPTSRVVSLPSDVLAAADKTDEQQQEKPEQISTISSSPESASAPGTVSIPAPASVPVLNVRTVEVHDVAKHKEWLQKCKTTLEQMEIKAVVQHFENPESSLAYGNRIISTVVVTFPSAQDRQKWNDSPQRLELFRRANDTIFTMISRMPIEVEHDLLSSYMEQLTGGAAAPIPRWRMTIVVQSAIFPTAVFLKSFLIPVLIVPLFPWLIDQPLVIQVCLSMSLTVPMMCYISLPIMTKLIGPYALDMNHTTNIDGTTNWKQILINGGVLGFTFLSMVEIALFATDGSGTLHDLVLTLIDEQYY